MLQLAEHPNNLDLGLDAINSLKFTRKSRLLKREDFNQVFDYAKKVASWPFVLLVKPNDNAKPRLGVILSKKRIPKAVQRNRVRRIIRESFRQQIGLGGMDVIILPKPNIHQMSNKQLKDGLAKEWQQCITRFKNS